MASHPVPQPKPHEIILHVAFAGVNRADIFQRQGSYPPPEGASPLPGLEAAGTVAAIGEAVTGWQVGDAVCALLPGGGYGEYVACHAGHALPAPKGWDMREAAALPEALFTVWMALQVEAGLKSGESVLVHGGASGVGMMAIQYATWLGARVFATASSPAKCAACESWGANPAIAYTEQDFVATIHEQTGGLGVNVVLDMFGGDYIARNLKALAPDGRLISIAFLRGAKPEAFSAAPLLLKRLMWKGTTLRARTDAQKAQWTAQIREKLGDTLAAGHIRPRIDRVFRLEDAQKAHAYMEQNLNIGKIVLQV